MATKHAHTRTDTRKASRPILNERDYLAAKSLLAREMHHGHTERIWARLEALMQEVADYEARFLQGDEEKTDWVEYAYESALEQAAGLQRRWSDMTDD